MRRFLLSFCVTSLSFAAVHALEPEVLEEWCIQAMSPNGEWIVSDAHDGNLTIKNLKSGDVWNYYADDVKGEYYAAAVTYQAISNTGILVGSQRNGAVDASYWKDGQWHTLPLLADDKGNSHAMAITPDGSRIVGAVGKTADVNNDNLQSRPVYWDLNAEGSVFLPYVELPHPTLDHFGRPASWVIAVNVSDNGSAIAGQLLDYFGINLTWPILFYKDENEDWQYKMLMYSMFYVDPADLPSSPGPEPSAPNPTDYMGAESLAKYQVAYDEYLAQLEAWEADAPDKLSFMGEDSRKAYEDALKAYDPESGLNAPDPYNYMTPEERADYDYAYYLYTLEMPYEPGFLKFFTESEYAAYLEAFDEYNAAYNAWGVLNDEYLDELYNIERTMAHIDRMGLRISPDGETIAASSVDDGLYIIHTAEDTFFNIGDDVYITTISTDGQMLGATGGGLNQPVYLTEDYEVHDFMTDFLAARNRSLFAWVDEHRAGGVPVASVDLSLVSLTEYTGSYETATAMYTSYLLPMEWTGSVDGIADDASAPAEYFNLQGIRISAPSEGEFCIERRGTTARKLRF